MVAASLISQLRRMVAEPTTAVYSDELLSSSIEAWPVLDPDGRDPEATGWEPTYDLHAAARDIWTEKAAGLAGDFDFSADGADYSRSQSYEQAMAQARYHGARCRPASKRLVKWPKEPRRGLYIY